MNIGGEPEISVVIPAFNAELSLGVQLRALAKQEAAPPFEVIVVDNGSTDRTADVAARYSDRLALSVIHAPEARSPSFARNVGVASARGSSVLFCDADDRVSTRWVSACAHALERSHLATGPTVYLDHVDGESEPEIAGRTIPVEPRLYLEQRQFAASNNMAIRADAFRRLGGFDVELLCGEDADLSIRAQEAGMELGWAQAALVFYAQRGTAWAVAKQFFRYGFYDAAVYRKLRGGGLGPRPLSVVVKPYLLVPLTAYRILGATRRYWVARASQLAGRLVGSARYRVFCP